MKYIIAMLLLVLSISTFGADGMACPNATTTMQIRVCFAKKFHQSQGILQKQYQQLNQTLQGSEREQLQASQNDWKRFLLSNCKLVANRYQGGTMQPLQLLACYAKMTDQRIQGLRTLFQMFNKK